MNFDSRTLGTIGIVDVDRRVILDAFEIAVDLAAARVAIHRPPDFEDMHTVSWGCLTVEEALRIAECEEHDPWRVELSEEVRRLFANAGPRPVTYFHRSLRNG